MWCRITTFRSRLLRTSFRPLATKSRGVFCLSTDSCNIRHKTPFFSLFLKFHLLYIRQNSVIVLAGVFSQCKLKCYIDVILADLVKCVVNRNWNIRPSFTVCYHVRKCLAQKMRIPVTSFFLWFYNVLYEIKHVRIDNIVRTGDFYRLRNCD